MYDSIYSFENNGRRKFADQAAETSALTEFAQRLGFADSDYLEHRTLLNKYESSPGSAGEAVEV
jgi:hypothetical protein